MEKVDIIIKWAVRLLKCVRYVLTLYIIVFLNILLGIDESYTEIKKMVI